MTKFKDELKAALDNFDIHHAQSVSERLHAAEENGYEITATEERLWARLTKCIESYWRTAYSLD